MKELGEHGSLTERFTSVIAGDVAFAQIQAARARKEIDDIQHGQKSGSDANSRLTSAAASKEMQGAAQDKAEKEAKEREEDALFLALLNNGDLDNYVAENIFGGMSDFEIADVVSAIEAETGLSFEDYAENILGDDMPERAPGESDADYHRRVLTAVADEILEDDLSIKAGYENDPLVKIIKRDAIFQDAKAFVDQTNELVPAHATPDAGTTNTVIEKASEGYSVSDTLGRDLENDTLSGAGTGVQDNSRDSVVDTASDMGALFAARETFNKDFKTAAAEPVDVEETAPQAAPDIKPVVPV